MSHRRAPKQTEENPVCGKFSPSASNRTGSTMPTESQVAKTVQVALGNPASFLGISKGNLPEFSNASLGAYFPCDRFDRWTSGIHRRGGRLFCHRQDAVLHFHAHLPGAVDRGIDAGATAGRRLTSREREQLVV